MADEDVEQRLVNLERSHNTLNGLAADLRDAMVVTAHLQKRQGEIQKMQAEEIVAAQQELSLVRESVSELRIAMDEVSDKLNGLIGGINPPKT